MKKIKFYIFLLISFSSLAHANGGFKDIKFGMTVSQLTDLGANDRSKICAPNTYFCDIPVSGRTLFGKPVSSIRVGMKSGVADSISVRVGFSPKEFIELADAAIGKSKYYSYTSAVGKNVNLNLWDIDAGHSIKIAYGADEIDGHYQRGLFGVVFNKSTDVEYLNLDSTKNERLLVDKNGKIDKKDF